MDFRKYTNTAIVKILKISVKDNRFKKYLPDIEKELLSRLRCHEVNIKNFSRFGIIPEMTKTMKDFLESFSHAE